MAQNDLGSPRCTRPRSANLSAKASLRRPSSSAPRVDRHPARVEGMRPLAVRAFDEIPTPAETLRHPPPPPPLINLREMSKTIAPSVALTTRATVPVRRWIPNCGSSRPDNADYQVADESVAATSYDVASKPPGDNGRTPREPASRSERSTWPPPVFDVAEAEREPEVQPNRLLNDLRREPVARVADF